MFVGAATLSILLAVSFLGSGGMKVFGHTGIVEGLNHLGVSRALGRVIGALEIAAAFGLLIGLAFGWLGVAAATGLVLLMVGAVIAHVRAGDYTDPKLRGPAIMPAVLMVLSVAAALLRLLSL